MDPILFGMDAALVGEVLGTIVVLSMFVERFLAPFFEWRVVLNKIANKGIKEPVALITSFVVVYSYGFDAMAIIFKEENNSWIGLLLTAGIIAGGSKGSIKLFRDYLGWKSEAQTELDAARSDTGKREKKKKKKGSGGASASKKP